MVSLRDTTFLCKIAPSPAYLVPLVAADNTAAPIAAIAAHRRKQPTLRDFNDLSEKQAQQAQKARRTLRGRSDASFLVKQVLTIAMAILALTYQHNFQYEGTRDGVPIYDGSAAGFTDWSFRTQVKWEAAKAEDKSRVMSQIIEGLRGDAADIVRDIGVTDVLKEDGLTVLTEALRKHVYPKKAAEAKLLYRHGHKQKGILTRQPSEPVANYISRRRRWWN